MGFLKTPIFLVYLIFLVLYTQALFVIVHSGAVSVVTGITDWFGNRTGVVYSGGEIGGIIATEVAGAEVGGVEGDFTRIHSGH
jgi:hypothetical protein